MSRLDKFFFGLLVFIPITATASFFGVSPLFIFPLSALAIVPLAKFIGEATEQLAVRVGPAIGGLLNASFGNATELIIGALAIKSGLIEVVKASLTGSIIGNLLLVTGMAMLFGGWKHKKQKFNRTAAMAKGSSLFVVMVALVMPAIFFAATQRGGILALEDLSIFAAVGLILLYLANLWFSLRTHRHLYMEKVGAEELKSDGWSKKQSISILFLATLFVSWMSDIMVGTIEPLVARLGWSDIFVGVIFVAIIGNVAEHVSAITMAVKKRMDLALSVAIGSAEQIAMFVAPFLVLVSILAPTPMNLLFNSLELISLVLAVVLINLIIADGESNWLEGLQLLVAYCVIAVAFFLHP